MNISKLNEAIKERIVYLYDDIEDACLKVSLEENQKKCEIKHKGKSPKEVDSTYLTAFNIMLSGKEITEKEYKAF